MIIVCLPKICALGSVLTVIYIITRDSTCRARFMLSSARSTGERPTTLGVSSVTPDLIASRAKTQPTNVMCSLKD